MPLSCFVSASGMHVRLFEMCVGRPWHLQIMTRILLQGNLHFFDWRILGCDVGEFVHTRQMISTYNHLFWLYLERPGTPQNFCEMWNLELAWFHELLHKPFKSEMIPWRRYRQMWNNSPQFQAHLALVMDGPSEIEKDTFFQRAYFGVLLI